MRCIIPCFLSLYLLALGFALSGEIAPANPEKGSSSKPAQAFQTVELLPLTGELVQDVDRISENLDRIRKVPKNLDRGATIEHLREQLAALVGWDVAIRKLGVTPDDKLARYSVYRDRAKGLAIAWRAFSHLIIETSSRRGKDSTHREDLLALDRPSCKESHLALLLTIQSHIHAAEKGKPSLLKTGTPNDAQRRRGDILSLWALVNLQLDTWHGRGNPDGRIDLARLAAWLRQLHDDKNLPNFGGGQAFRQRLDCIQKFVAFRDACGKDLRALINDLKSFRLSPATSKMPPHIKELIDACKQIEGESLPQAAVWLRYVILLSYQGEGVQVLAGSSDYALSKWWEKLQETSQVGDFCTDLRLERKIRRNGFLRWNAWPEEGHIVHALAHATDAAYRYALWEAGRPALEKSRYETAVKAQARDDYVKKLRQHVKDLEDLYCADLQCYFVQETPRSYDEWLFARPMMASGADDAARYKSSSFGDGERKRIENDLAELAAITTSANKIQKAILDAYEAKDPAAVSAWLQGPAIMDGMARWTPFDLPQRSFHEYYHQVMDNVKRLKDGIKDEQLSADLKQLYKEQVEQNEILAGEVAIARLGLEIAEQGKQVADCFKHLAELDTRIAGLMNNWSELDKRAKELKVKRAELQLGLAAQARELAAAKVEGLKEAVEIEATGKECDRSIGDHEASLA